MKKYIVYYRVSTKEQGKSGLGLKAQRTVVERFTDHCKNCVIAEFTDIASGKNDNRIELTKAIECAKANNAKLLIAKLDRLSRNAAFIFQLRDSKVDFVCCDMPDANTLTIGIFATLAQHEREIISNRTKAALQAKKMAGFKLGNPNGFISTAQDKATDTKRIKAQNNTNTVKAVQRIIELIEMAQYKKRSLTIDNVADRLNQYNLRTATGKVFTPSNVRYILKSVLNQMNLRVLPKYSTGATIATPAQNNPQNNIEAFTRISALKEKGSSFASIAADLNANGYVTSRNNQFKSMTVKRIYDKYNVI